MYNLNHPSQYCGSLLLGLSHCPLASLGNAGNLPLVIIKLEVENWCGVLVAVRIQF